MIARIASERAMTRVGSMIALHGNEEEPVAGSIECTLLIDARQPVTLQSVRNNVTYSLAVLKDMIIPAAQQELLPRFARVERQHKRDGSVLTEADLAVQSRIAAQLLQQWPETVFLGEEMTAAEQVGFAGWRATGVVSGSARWHQQLCSGHPLFLCIAGPVTAG